MTPEQFAYWLQGFAEVNQAAPNDAQWTIIKDHLATVFKKETPNRITIPGPSISPGPINPVNPMNPYPTWPNPLAPHTTPNYPRPEIICSVSAPGAGINWSSGAGSYNINDVRIKSETNERFRI